MVDRADTRIGIGGVGGLGIHVDDEQIGVVAEGDEAAVGGGVALAGADAVVDGDGEGPGAGLGAGGDVVPGELGAGRVDVDELVGMSPGGMPAVVVEVGAGAGGELGPIAGAVEEQGRGGPAAAVLDHQQRAVGAPGLLLGVDVAGVGAPGAGDRGGGLAGIVADPRHPRAEGRIHHRAQIPGLRHPRPAWILVVIRGHRGRRRRGAGRSGRGRQYHGRDQPEPDHPRAPPPSRGDRSTGV